MADSFTANVNLRLPEVGAATDTWGGIAGLNGDLERIDAIFLATGLSTVGPTAGSLADVPGVGLRIGAGMVLNVEGNLVAAEDATITGTFAITGTLGFIGPGTFSTTSFLHKDYTDPTKVAVLDPSLITTATARTLQWPDENGILATRQWATANLTPPAPPTNAYAQAFLPSDINVTYNAWHDVMTTSTTFGAAGQVWLVFVNVVCSLHSSASPGTQYCSLRVVNHTGAAVGPQTTITVTGASINENATLSFATSLAWGTNFRVQAFAHSSSLQMVVGQSTLTTVRII